MATPAYSLKIVRVVEQGQVSFVRFLVMDNGRARVRTAIGQVNLAPLTAEVIAGQYKSA